MALDVASGNRAPLRGDGARELRSPSSFPDASRRWLRTFASAAAVAGFAEVLLARIAAPVAAHVPGAGAGWAAALQRLGDAAVGAAALLVVATAVILAVTLPSRHLPLVVSTAAAASATVLAVAAPDRWLRAGVHVLVVGALVAVMVRLARSSSLAAAAVALLAGAVALAQWPLLATALGWSATAAMPVRTAAEVSMVALPILLVFAARRDRRPGAMPIALALAAGTLTIAALAAQPDHVAIVALWSIGASLALPALCYGAGAAAAAYVLAVWGRRRDRRLQAAGLVLLLVAGLQPALVHHNLTALVAVILLAFPYLERSTP